MKQKSFQINSLIYVYFRIALLIIIFIFFIFFAIKIEDLFIVSVFLHLSKRGILYLFYKTNLSLVASLIVFSRINNESVVYLHSW